MKDLILKFLATNPGEEQIEQFYCNKVLPHTKQSINEILAIR